MNPIERYQTPDDLPDTIPVFPLDGALLLPRAQLPLNIFEPRYLQMVEAAMSGERIIGMIQTDAAVPDEDPPALCKVGCAGRITNYAETPDNRLLITLGGVCRFEVKSELASTEPFRSIAADFDAFRDDLIAGLGEEEVDREDLLRAFRAYLDANDLEADWQEITSVPNEALVNALSMMSPYQARDKQALLEAADLKSRAEVLVALTNMALASRSSSGDGRLQ
ncbi:MAG: LON peptidase substrate-binding domain-containing protein [Aestuariivirgaceae bacterium]